MGTIPEGDSVDACRMRVWDGSYVPTHSSAAPALTHRLRGCRGDVSQLGPPSPGARAPPGSTLLQTKVVPAKIPVPDEMSSFVLGNSWKPVLSPIFQLKPFLYSHVQNHQVLRGSLSPNCDISRGCLKHWVSEYFLLAGNVYD